MQKRSRNDGRFSASKGEKDWKDKGYKGKPKDSFKKKAAYPGGSTRKGEPLEKDLEEFPKKDSGKPTEPVNSPRMLDMVKSSYKALSQNSLSFKVDPNTEATAMATPYAIIAESNPVVAVHFGGDPNLSGVVIKQLARASTSSLNNIFDLISLRVDLNYGLARYQKESQAPQSVNDQIGSVFEEVLNTIKADANYSLPYFQWVVSADAAAPAPVRDTTYFTDTLNDINYFYQGYLQQIKLVASSYRKIRAMEEQLLNMTFYEGRQIVQRMFGLLKKRAFTQGIDAIESIGLQNYFDVQWYDSIKNVYLNPSRKFDGMLSPLMDIIPKYKLNFGLKVQVDTVTIIKTNDYKVGVDAAQAFIELISIESLLTKARTGFSDFNAGFINLLTSQLDIMLASMNKFVTEFADLNVAFKTMSEAALTSWSQSWAINVNSMIEDYKPSYIINHEDLLRSLLTGASNITWDSNTLHYYTYDLWDKFTNIPRYLETVGGSFMTFSTKNVVNTGAPGNIMYPVLFNGNLAEIKTVSRQGAIITITKVSEAPIVSPIMARISPLTSTDAVNINVPSINLTTLTDIKARSWVTQELMQLLGYVKTTAPQVNYALSESKITLIDIQLEDPTIFTLNYTRIHSPFKTLNTQSKA